MLLPVALLVIAAWTQSAVAQSFVGDQCYSHDGSEAPGCHRRRLETYLLIVDCRYQRRRFPHFSE